MKTLLMAVLLISVSACAGPQSLAVLTPAQLQAVQFPACAGARERAADCGGPVVSQAAAPSTAAMPPLLPAPPALPTLSAQNAGTR